jgi:hypothetical protein
MYPLIKRTWYYVQKPQEWGIGCPKCKGINLAWSEYEGCIWCFDCEKDLKKYVNPLSGPVPINFAAIFGICFDRFNIVSGKVDKYDADKNEWVPG